jgi:hypothetical protein
MDSPSTGDLRRCGALLTGGWACSFGSPNESFRPPASKQAADDKAVELLGIDFQCVLLRPLLPSALEQRPLAEPDFRVPGLWSPMTFGYQGKLRDIELTAQQRGIMDFRFLGNFDRHSWDRSMMTRG